MDQISIDSPTVIARIEGHFGRLSLNRPKALNALSIDMIEAMLTTLRAWALDDRIKAVLLDHEDGTRGFCAGGDIRYLAQSGRMDGKAGAHFFAQEYRLNRLIKTFPKPFISVLDGICMGGGVGISINGTHRIATENTVFAMPETAIGMIPDVGGAWFLPRLKDALGFWLAVTGERLKGHDLAASGLATHYIASKDCAAVKQALLTLDLNDHATQKIDATLTGFVQPVAKPSYDEHLEIINRCFSRPTVSDIAIALKMDDSDWSQAQGELMMHRCPLSMCVTLKHMLHGAQALDFDETLVEAYRIATRLICTHDFSEGVRALIEDKDNRPRWNPHAIGCVNPSEVAKFFAPLPQDLSF